MTTIDVKFDVPDWVAEGIRKETLKIFGGVVRNKAGEIVYHLSKAKTWPSRSGWYLAATVAAVATVAGTTYYLYRKSSKRGRALNALERLEKATWIYLRRAQDGFLSLDQVRNLSTDLQRFIELVEELGDQHTGIAVDDRDVLSRLIDFHNSLRAFNLKLSGLSNSPKSVPPPASEPDNLLDLTKQVQAQLMFQERVWPKENSNPT